VPLNQEILLIKDKLEKLFPRYPWLKKTLVDKKAQEVKKGKKEATYFFVIFDETEEELLFLKAVCNALTTYGLPAALLPAALADHKKADYFLGRERTFLSPLLSAHYDAKARLLYNKPLFFLKELSIYLQSPQEKAHLWHQLKQQLPLPMLALS
jgi:hypothetical protein